MDVSTSVLWGIILIFVIALVATFIQLLESGEYSKKLLAWREERRRYRERRKKNKKIILLGILFILIAVFNPLKNILLLIFIAIKQGNPDFIWIQFRQPWFGWLGIFFRFDRIFDYIGLERTLGNLYKIFPVYQAKSIATLIACITTYIPILCRLAIFVSGIGFFFERKIFRLVAIGALSTMLILEALNSILSLVHFKHFYFDRAVVLLLFAWIIYYLTRPKIKEHFN